MAVTKIVELVGESKVGWEDAVRCAVKTASRTIRNITGVHVLNMTGNVNDAGEIVEYKADIEIAFLVDGTDD
ncbi:MAG: dodecin domain-containing protein [Firmicutes bacterium]|nr:dodecin domain-containing protein [Bacillota bacterium]